MNPTHNDMIEAKEVYSQLSFERYKEKLMLCNLSSSVYVPRFTDWHHKSCQVMTNGNPEWQIFLSHPYKMYIMESFPCSPLKTSFHIGNTWKSLPENTEYAEMRYNDITLILPWRWKSQSGAPELFLLLIIKYCIFGKFSREFISRMALKDIFVT